MELQSVWSGAILASFTGHHAVHIVAYVTIVLRSVTYFVVGVFFIVILMFISKHLMVIIVSVLISGLSSLGLHPGKGYFIVFLDKTLHSHSASLHPGV